MESLHKVVNPSSYSCKLCQLTYGIFEEKRGWRKFRENLDIETEFFHRDEFLKAYASKFGHKFEFPVILVQSNKGLEVLMTKNEFSEIDSPEELIKRIENRLDNY